MRRTNFNSESINKDIGLNGEMDPPLSEKTPVEPRPRLKMLIEFDGTDFAGWQYQPGLRTVQGELEAALTKILGERTVVIGAGRTDSGVHARGMTAHFEARGRGLSSDRLRLAVNGEVGPDLLVRSIEPAPPRFHARFHARSRRYSYRVIDQPYPLWIRYAWFHRQPWDNRIIQQTLPMLLGAHSFRSFSRARPGETDYRCEVLKAEWTVVEGGAEFEIEADRFFHQMVRGLVRALIDVGRGHISPEQFRELLDYPTKNSAVRYAPPQGLILEEVIY